MWADALSLLESAERLQRQFFRAGATARARWEPPVDVFQDKEGLWIFVAVPGVSPDQIEVVMEETTLVVRGERPLPLACREAHILRLEIPYGAFERRIALPPGRYQVLQRLLEQGVLVLGLRKLD